MDFVPVSEIPANEEIENNKAYQVQGVKDKNIAVINLVGEFKESNDVRITSFKFKKYNCQLVSCLLTKDSLNDKGSDFLNILKILICNDSNVLIGRLTLGFKLKDDMLIGKELNGEFVIQFTCEKGMLNVGNLEKYPGSDQIVPKFVEYMLNEDVLACLEQD